MVLGGAKVADKIGVVAALVELADVVAVGGRMAFTLLAAKGVSVGSTQIEADWLEVRQGVGKTVRPIGPGGYGTVGPRGGRGGGGPSGPPGPPESQ